MKLQRLYSLIFALIFFASIFHETYSANHTKTIAKLTQKILSRRSNTPKTQKRLWTLIKKIDTIPVSLIPEIVHALSRENAFPFLHENQTVIENAWQTLAETPGFDLTIKRLLKNAQNPNNAKGSLYELCVATRLAQQENVVELNNKREIPDQRKREFDVITPTVWIECKTINWKQVSPKSPKGKILKLQLTEQQKIVAHHAEQTPPIAYRLYSQQPISPKWHSWMTEQNIDAREMTS